MWRLGMLLGLGALVAPAPATAQTYYRYQTENGNVAYTDQLERVPKRYKEAVQAFPARTLRDYGRTTLVETRPAARPTRSLLPLGVEETSAEGIHVVSLEVGSGVSIDVPADSDEPIRVNRVWRWEEGRYYPFTIVRRGDQVLAEIRDD